MPYVWLADSNTKNNLKILTFTLFFNKKLIEKFYVVVIFSHNQNHNEPYLTKFQQITPSTCVSQCKFLFVNGGTAFLQIINKNRSLTFPHKKCGGTVLMQKLTCWNIISLTVYCKCK